MPAITDLPIWTSKGYEIRTQGTTDTTATTYTYNSTMASYVFRNDGSVNLTLTVGGTPVTVASGEIVTGGSFSSFIVQASSGTISWTMRAFDEASTATATSITTSPSSNMSALLTFQSGATAIGNGTAQDVSGYNTVSIDVVISGTAGVQFEGSLDGSNYVAMNCILPALSNASFSSTTGSFRGVRFNVSGFKFFRARISSYASGTVDVTGYATTASILQLQNISTFGSSDTNAAGSLLAGVGAYNLIYDNNSSVWSRQRTAGSLLDGSNGVNISANGLFAYNGSAWDRVRAVNGGQLLTTIKSSSGAEVNIGNTLATDNTNLANGMVSNSALWGYNGTAFDKLRVDANKNLKVATTAQSTSFTATIATSGTVSDAITLLGNNLVGLIMPSTWDGGNITIQACDTSGGTYVDVYDSNGNIATITGGASRMIGLTGSIMQAVANAPYIKLKCATAVAASRSIVVLSKG